MALRKLLALVGGALREIAAADAVQFPAAACFAAEYNAGNSSSAITIDFANGQKQRVTLTANTTITVSAPPGVGHYQLRMIQDGTGGRTVAYSGLSASRWLGSDSAPPINDAANGETILNGYYDGTNWVQSLVKVGAA